MEARIKTILLLLLFPFLCHAGANPTDTVTVRIGNKVYELTAFIDTGIHDTGKLSIFRIKLTRDGRTIHERNFPLMGRCPIEEDIKVEGSDSGFIIRIPYCDGYLFRFGEARFVYSNKQDDFVLAAYNEEIIDRQHPERKNRNIKYDLPENRVTLSGFSPCTIRNKTDTLYYNVSSTNLKECQLRVKSPMHPDARFFGEEAIGRDSPKHVDDEIVKAPVP